MHDFWYRVRSKNVLEGNGYYTGSSYVASRIGSARRYRYILRKVQITSAQRWICLKVYTEGRITLHLKNCFSSQTQSTILNISWHPNICNFATKTIGTVRELNYPMTTSEQRPFLGLCIDNHRFILNFSRETPPLNKRLKKDEGKQFELEMTMNDVWWMT